VPGGRENHRADVFLLERLLEVRELLEDWDEECDRLSRASRGLNLHIMYMWRISSSGQIWRVKESERGKDGKRVELDEARRSPSGLPYH